VQKKAPARKADRRKEARRESKPLTSEIGLACRLDIEQFGRPMLAQPGPHDRRIELSAAEEPGNARTISRIVFGCEARNKPKQGGERGGQQTSARLACRPFLEPIV